MLKQTDCTDNAGDLEINKKEKKYSIKTTMDLIESFNLTNHLSILIDIYDHLNTREDVLEY